MHRALLLLLLVGCGGSEAAKPTPGCERLPFAADVPISEVSGAAVMTVDGRELVLVVGDSGQAGAYALIEAASGAVVERGQLPLGDGASDDLEGLTLDGDRLLAVTSSGWIRAWRRVDGGFALVDGPYAVGAPPASCTPTDVNCGRNYEGLCTTPRGPCAGWLASKADGHLYCLERAGQRLRAAARSIAVSAPDTLTGCDADPTGVVWAATNAFDGALYKIDGDRVTSVEAELGVFPEAIAVAPGGILLRFSDLSAGRSPAERLRCR